MLIIKIPSIDYVEAGVWKHPLPAITLALSDRDIFYIPDFIEVATSIVE